MASRVFAGCALLAALAGCSSFYPVQVTRLGEPLGPPRGVEHVEIYSQSPPRPFVEVARLSTESANYDSPGHAVERLRKVAAEQGADAIIVEDRGARVASPGLAGSPMEQDFGYIGGDSRLTGASSGYSVASYARATAIRWTTPDPTDLRGSLASRAATRPAREPDEDEGTPSRPADAPFFRP
ncbi:MAG TPA: hypothetical protein VKE69_14280 [Planctomycetota bacterium]|nr:hypothetical protein [Planctomycetota bacterium]